MIALNSVQKSYSLGNVCIPVLKGITLSVQRGEFVAIMGPSGSGKSTLLNIIGCLDTFDSGGYQLGNISISGASETMLAEIRNRRLGFVFQAFNLIPRINAVRNVELPLIYSAISPEERKQRAHSMLNAVGLADRAEHSPAQLSGGQQQRVAIARSMVNNPDVLIADEPTGSLDSNAGREIMLLFNELNRSGVTIIMVTHEEEIAAFATRIVRLRDGAIQSDVRR